MKNKKVVIAIVSIIVLAMLFGIPFALKSNSKAIFKNEKEMAEIVSTMTITGIL